jgi:hypothetical protein
LLPQQILQQFILGYRELVLVAYPPPRHDTVFVATSVQTSAVKFSTPPLAHSHMPN